MKHLPLKPPRGNWIQVERNAGEAWAQFLTQKGALAASRVMLTLLARMGENNAVVISQGTLAELLGYDIRTVRRAVAMLRDQRWIEVRQIGQHGMVNAYVINDRVAWSGPRDGIRYSLFSASVVLSEREQPDAYELGHQEPLQRVPSLPMPVPHLPDADRESEEDPDRGF